MKKNTEKMVVYRKPAYIVTVKGIDDKTGEVVVKNVETPNCRSDKAALDNARNLIPGFSPAIVISREVTYVKYALPFSDFIKAGAVRVDDVEEENS